MEKEEQIMKWLDRAMFWTGVAMWVGILIYFVVTA
jgi:hypothetical protein